MGVGRPQQICIAYTYMRGIDPSHLLKQASREGECSVATLSRKRKAISPSRIDEKKDFLNSFA
jgi:hypothetical protein